MNSATTMLLALVPAGGHIVTTTDCYRRTRQFIQTVLPKMGISASVLDPADMAGLERTLQQHAVSLFFSGMRSPLALDSQALFEAERRWLHVLPSCIS
jgi:cystathionine gamma-synthase